MYRSQVFCVLIHNYDSETSSHRFQTALLRFNSSRGQEALHFYFVIRLSSSYRGRPFEQRKIGRFLSRYWPLAVQIAQ